jgi:hypothetical protein
MHAAKSTLYSSISRDMSWIPVPEIRSLQLNEKLARKREIALSGEL